MSIVRLCNVFEVLIFFNKPKFKFRCQILNESKLFVHYFFEVFFDYFSLGNNLHYLDIVFKSLEIQIVLLVETNDLFQVLVSEQSQQIELVFDVPLTKLLNEFL